LNLANKEVYAKIVGKKTGDLWNIIRSLIATLFTRDLNADDIVYFWDCIFVNEMAFKFDEAIRFTDHTLHFTDFIVLATLILNKDNIEKDDFELIYLASLRKLNGKEIVKRAIKLREKINSSFS